MIDAPSDTLVRLQCLEMANRQPTHTDAGSVVHAAQELYDFATNKRPTGKHPALGAPYGKAKRPAKRPRR